MDAKAANGQYWDPRQPLPPAPLVRDAAPAENLRGQRREEYQRCRAVEEGQLVNYNQAADRRNQAAARNARNPDHNKAMMDPGPVELEAMIATLSLSNDNWVDDSAWKYYVEKYNVKREVRPVCEFHQEIEPVKCPVGQDLVKYLANREKDCEKSQLNPHCMRNNLLWCRRRESLDQE
jgi:hypothetical protein